MNLQQNDSSPLLVHRENGVITLTLNRPEVLNAFTREVLEELCTELEAAAADGSIGAIVLTGTGRAFCVGADLRDGAVLPPADANYGLEQLSDAVRHAVRCSKLLHQIPKPTIAMIRGAAAGAGLALAAACDLRVASENATFTTSFAKVGLSGDFGATYFLTRLVGTAKARELFYLSEKLDAAEALRIGLVNRVVADDQLESVTAAVASQIGNGPRVANRYLKRNLNEAEEGGLEQMLDIEALHLARTITTEDTREAVRAFLEKRPPQFRGR